MTNRTTLAALAQMSKEKLSELPIDHLAMCLEDVAELKAQAKSADEKITSELDRRFGWQAAAVRRNLGKDTGTVTLAFDDAKVKADLPAKIGWNQSKLAAAVETIRSWDGEDPADYVSVEYKVSEMRYKAWPPSIRKLFEPARTVATGKPSYSVELKQESA